MQQCISIEYGIVIVCTVCFENVCTCLDKCECVFAGNWTFAKAKRSYADKICADILSRICKYIDKQQIPVPDQIRSLLCALMIAIPFALPHIQIFRNILLNKMQKLAYEYLLKILPILRALAAIWRIDYSHKTTKNIKTNKKIKKWDSSKKMMVEKVCNSMCCHSL